MSKNIYRIKKKGDLDEIMRNNFLKPICIVFASKSSDQEFYKNVSETLLAVSKKNSYIMQILIDFDDFIDNIDYFKNIKENLPYFLCFFKGKNIANYDSKENFIPIIINHIEKINESYLNKLMTLFNNESTNTDNNLQQQNINLEEDIENNDNKSSNNNSTKNNSTKNNQTESDNKDDDEDEDENEDENEDEDEDEDEKNKAESDTISNNTEKIKKEKQKLKKIKELKKLQEMLKK
jgi:hypothetical protein